MVIPFNFGGQKGYYIKIWRPEELFYLFKLGGQKSYFLLGGLKGYSI